MNNTLVQHTPGPWTLQEGDSGFGITPIGVTWLRSHSTNPVRDAEIPHQNKASANLPTLDCLPPHRSY